MSLTGDTLSYSNNNFGRVIEANRALVLEKEQAVNDCDITTLPPSTQNNLNYSKSALVDIDPGQCIAYRVTATNRSNLEISNFVMTDALQLADGTTVKVTSKLAEPIYNSADYAANSVNIDNNGLVITKSFTIAPRACHQLSQMTQETR